MRTSEKQVNDTAESPENHVTDVCVYQFKPTLMSSERMSRLREPFRRVKLVVLCGIASLAISASASAAGAQTPPSTPPDDKDCKRAAKIVEKGKPEKKEDWAFAVLHACSPAISVPAAASAIASMHSERDSVALLNAWTPFFRVLDVAITSAFVNAIADPAATPQARIVAALGLASQVSDGTGAITYADAASAGVVCRIGVLYASGSTIGNAPTQATAARTLATLVPLEDDAKAPPTVRSAVSCVLILVRNKAGVPQP